MKKLASLVLCMALIMGFVVVPGESKAATYPSNPVTVNGVTTWDCIYFGNYYQSDVTGNTKEPIKWRVLSVEGDDAFLLADVNLDRQQYNPEWEDTTWATCTLRTWLNHTFLSTAFTSAQQSAIKDTNVVNEDNPSYGTTGGENTVDKIYLPSIQEVSNPLYGFCSNIETKSETRLAKNTAYEKAIEIPTEEEYGSWSLRTPGTRGTFILYVGNQGDSDYHGDGVDCGGAVRPVLHMSLSDDSLWTMAEPVCATGADQKEVVTDPTPTPAVPVATPVPVQEAPALLSTNPVTVTAPGKAKLSTVKNAKGKKVTCSYKKVADAVGYQIQYSTNKSFKKAKSKVATKTSVTISKLQKGKTYYIRIRAYTLDGTKKVYGKWGQVKKVKVKK